LLVLIWNAPWRTISSNGDPPAHAQPAAALHAEVAAYITGHAHEADENRSRLVVRNGYHDERAVLKAAGAVMVRAVRVNDKRVDPESGARQRFLRRSRLRSTGKAVDTQSTEKPRSTTVPVERLTSITRWFGSNQAQGLVLGSVHTAPQTSWFETRLAPGPSEAR